ncbi:FAD-dependent oxidoreductase [Thalassolituus sp. LLYu03]|uniref:FAD-dependent oxidoreductase n=1 Tax=Thalassolituus sp. LLYu03 TaxID=3421656 RepID=UPI003D28832D
MSDHQPEAVIAGAGLMGSLLAWRLARAGFRVRVYEASAEQTPAAAAHTAAAMVAPWAERSVCGESVFQAGRLSLQLWPALLAELATDSGVQVTYGQLGSLVVAHPADHAELARFRRDMAAIESGEDDVQALSGEAIQVLEPALNEQFSAGFWLKQEAHIDNRALLPALRAAARAHGAQFEFSAPVHELPAAELVLDCRGVGARAVLPALRGVRGEVLWIESDVQLTRPVRLLHPKYHLYLVPKGGSAGRWRYILGATEIDSEDRSPVSVRSALEMLSALYCLSPALAEARILSFEANLRPALPDHQALLQEFFVPGGRGLRINGLFRHGYLLAPALLTRLQQEFELPLALPAAEEATCAFI